MLAVLPRAFWLTINTLSACPCIETWDDMRYLSPFKTLNKAFSDVNTPTVIKTETSKDPELDVLQLSVYLNAMSRRLFFFCSILPDMYYIQA